MVRCTIFICAQKLTNSQLNLPHRTKKNKKSNEETKNKKTEILRRNSPVIKSMESVLRLEESLWWERFVNMNRQVGDRGTGMRLTERTRKLIPETRERADDHE